MPKAQNNGSFDGETYQCTNSHLVVPGSTYTLPMATLHVPGLKFIGWEATTDPDGDTYTSPYTTDTTTLYQTGDRDTVTGNICFVARYEALDITLVDNLPNGETLNEYNGMTVSNLILSGRTLVKNGNWNTLRLPFSLSAAQLAASPLAGCTLMQLDTAGTYATDKKTGFDPNTGTLYLYFKDTTAIAAGTPYIIKWTSGDNITNPVFQNVTIANVTADVPAPYVIFRGTYSPRTLAEDRRILYLGADNALHYPDDSMSIKSCRAYFQLSDILSTPAQAPIRIVMNISEGNTTTDLNPAHEVIDRAGEGETIKFLRNGVLYIRKDDIIYDALGRRVK